jgi:hypothetical protein
MPERDADTFALAQRYRRERDDARRELAELRATVTRHERERLVMTLAARLGFRDPGDAWAHAKHWNLSAEQWESDAEMRRALTQLLAEKPYLSVRYRVASSEAGGVLSFDDIASMSAEEINRRWDEVQSVLEAKA